MRRRAVLWRALVLAAWVGAVAVLVALDSGHDEPTWYITVGPPLTLLVGIVVDRWWALAAPSLVSAVLVLGIVVTGGECAECTAGEWPDEWFTSLLAVFTVPASLLLALGVSVRRLGRFLRRLPRGGQHASP